ncbi:MAG: hypothetical protein K5892_05210 [Acholeplasmatales bacterium]|nr:hypothetical protein [Acholeplasmatales bacterium]
MGKTSLEKSHSKVSNFKLTMLCVLAAFFFNLAWIGLLIFREYNVALGAVILGVSDAICLLLYLALGRFTR